MLRYARLVSRWPWVVALAVLVTVSACAAAAFKLVEWPDFSEDPVKGFEARGTRISGANKAIQHMIDAVNTYELVLTPRPSLGTGYPKGIGQGDSDPGGWEQEVEDEPEPEVTDPENGEQKDPVTTSADPVVTMATSERRGQGSDDVTYRDDPETVTHGDFLHYETSDRPQPPVVNTTRHRRRRQVDEDCASEWIGHNTLPKIVFQAKGSHSLLSASTLKEICRIDDLHMRYYSQFNSRGCPSHSLSLYVSSLSRKHCANITDNDVDDLINLLQDCANAYSKGFLGQGCDRRLNSSDCVRAPPRCHKYNAVLYIFEFLTDRQFFDNIVKSKSGDVAEVTLKYTSMFVTTVYRDDVLDIFTDSLDAASSADWQTVEIVGIDIGDHKYRLFEQYLMEDILYFALAAFLILFIMCIYLHSFAMTIATILNVGFSFLLAYFFYHVVCRFTFFPFLNLLSILVLLGVGADDVFIFVDVWKHEKLKSEEETDMTEHLHRTLKHALLTIFVTSVTTAAAFFSNAISSITAVRCFAIFSGIAIMANFLLMVTWFPAVLVMVEWMNQSFSKRSRCRRETNPCSPETTNDQPFLGRLRWLLSLPGQALHTTFNKILPFVITKFWYVWLGLLTALGVAGLILVLYKPKLSLPTSGTFQLFQKDHPIERFEVDLSKEFRYTDNVDSFSGVGMRATYVWGIKNVDNGNHVNPDSMGHLEYDHDFDLTAPEAQLWMSKQCESIKRNTSFISDYSKEDPCLFPLFIQALAADCHFFPPAYQDCCNRPFPTSRDVFKKCFPAFVYILPTLVSRRPMDYPLFDDEGNVKVYLIDFYTNHSYSTSYSGMGDYSDSLNTHLDKALRSAPGEVRDGWVFSDLRFYDLQRALSTDTYIAFGMSLAVALLVILLTSLNLVLSMYAVVNIGLSIAVTVGLLVLLGWELNILESITLSLSIGLSIDFSIHYAVAYRLCDSSSPAERVTFALSRVGPAIAMASVTTFLAGSAIMGTRILAYTQLGTFLMIVMVVSWVFATFFFLPLCAIAGPRGKCAQVSCPPRTCESQSNKNVAKVSEDTRF